MWLNFWYNRDREKKRDQLKESITQPKSRLSSGSHFDSIRTSLITKRTIFNKWKFGQSTFTIIEKCSMPEYRRLLKRKVCDEIWENQSGSAILVSNIGKAPNPRNEITEPRIAITTLLLSGFEHVEPWVKYYAQSKSVKLFYIYVNAEEVPNDFLKIADDYHGIELIAWDFPYFVRKTHFHSSHQEGHAQPSSISDAYYRAATNSMTHLLPIDIDEYIFPLQTLSEVPTFRPLHFLNANARWSGGKFPSQFEQNTSITDAEQSARRSWEGTGTSEGISPFSFGKTLTPIDLSAPPPNIHISSSFKHDSLMVEQDALLCHFRELEGTRTYLTDVTFRQINEIIFQHYCTELWGIVQDPTNKMLREGVKKIQHPEP